MERNASNRDYRRERGYTAPASVPAGTSVTVRAELRKPGGSGQYAATTFTLDKNGNLKSQTELDYGVSVTRDSLNRPTGVPAGTALRTVEHDYHYETQLAAAALGASYAQTDNNAYWKNFALLHKRARRRSTVRNGSGTIESATEYAYDNAATTANVVAEAKWDDTRAGLPGLGGLNRTNAAVTEFAWYKGNVTRQTSAAMDVTDFAYDAIAGCPAAASGQYATRVVAHFGQGALEETQEYGYDCATGALKEKVSEPGQGAKVLVTRGTYDDFGRVQGEAVYSGGNLLRQPQTSYDDGQRWVRVASSLDGASDMRLSAVHWFDGMGSLRLSRSNDDSGGAVTALSAGGVVTERAWRYFTGGRYEVESKGWRPVAAAGVAEPPRAWVRRRLDAAGRLLAVETFAAKPYPWGTETNAMGGVSYVYSGNVTVETDAAGRTREETRDGLGRLTMVRQGQENPAVYGYNGRDLLVGVTQADTGSYGVAVTQTRSFGYDSLGRLRWAANPESGTQSYEYELDGLLRKKTDGRGVAVTMSYDGARRLTGKAYTDGTGAAVFCYDGMVYAAGACGTQEGRSGDAGDYPKGRMTGSGTGSGWRNHLRVDALGRTVRVEQGAGTFRQTMEFEYAANGARKRVVYPSGR